MSKILKMTKEQIKFRLEELVNICDNSSNFLLDFSIEDMLDYLRIAIIYKQFDIEATRRELVNERERKI